MKSSGRIVAINNISVLICLILGWKLNPVVSAVYSPEFYAGRKMCPSPSITDSFVVMFLPLIHFVLQLLRHLHFLHLLTTPPPFHFNLHHLCFSLFLQTCNQAKSVCSITSPLLSHTNVTTSVICTENFWLLWDYTHPVTTGMPIEVCVGGGGWKGIDKQSNRTDEKWRELKDKREVNVSVHICKDIKRCQLYFVN